MAGGLFADSVLDGVQRIRSSWGWFMGLGVLLIVCGLICIAGDVTATFATVFAFGWLMMLSGVVALVHAFRVHTWNGFFLYLMSALLRGFTGYVLVTYPVAGAVGITLVLASFFVVGGLFRAIGAGILGLPQWGWSVFSGNCLSGSGNHSAHANAGLKPVVYWVCHWSGFDFGRSIAGWLCEGDPSPAQACFLSREKCLCR
jgi:uncharacterized membrane protein HdeD (DUF308 family)